MKKCLETIIWPIQVIKENRAYLPYTYAIAEVSEYLQPQCLLYVMLGLMEPLQMSFAEIDRDMIRSLKYPLRGTRNSMAKR